MERVLIVSAHPDDDILGCGGVMSKFKGKVEFKVVFIGEGSSCRFTNPDSEEAKKEIEIRNSYAVRALKTLGVDNINFYNLPCGRFDMVPLIEINKIIENEISIFKPNTIFTHSDLDSNKDHVKVYESTIIATRPNSGVSSLFSFEVLTSSEWNYNKSFKPNVFYTLSDKNVNEKWDALKIYSTEVGSFPFPRSKKGIISLANYRGMQSGVEYAEAFHLIRQFKK